MSSHPLHAESSSSDASWHEIDDLLDYLAQVSKSPLSQGEFHRLLLDRLVGAIGAAGGAIWTSARPGELCLEYQINLAVAQSESREPLDCHQRLVDEVLRGSAPHIAPPRSGAVGGGSQGNPTDRTLILCPFKTGAQASGVVELVEQGGLTATEGRARLRLLAAVVELTEDYHRNHELGQLRQREQSWREHDRFAERVHQSLDVRQTAFLVANDGRRTIGCDRLSVLAASGSKCRALAISGVDALDRRAKVVRALEQLAARCLATGDPVWYCNGAADIAAEIEQSLEAYLDLAHSRTLAMVPLVKPRLSSDDKPTRVVGILVAEQFHASPFDAEFRDRVTGVARHSSVALSNAISHSHLPLARVGRMLARVRWFTEARRLPKTLLALAAIAAVVAALTLVPADFDIEARGEVQPKLRRDIFATDDGVVSELLIDQAQAVRSAQPLVVIRKPELDLEFRRVAGEMQTAQKKLAAVRAERLENAPAGPDARHKFHQLAADEEELKELLKGLGEQRAILERQQSDLTVRSPMEGVALTWNIKQSLEARPVQRGQTLLTVADLDGPWILELHVDDTRCGHVLAARDELRPDLDVSFALASDPGIVHEGKITDVALSTEMNDRDEPTVLVTTTFDRREVPGLRPGATVIAKIHCGRRSVGYVWLHDLFEFVQSHWWW